MRPTLVLPSHGRRFLCLSLPSRLILFILLINIPGGILFSQQSNLTCNNVTPWTPNTFAVNVDFSSSALSCWDGDPLCVVPGTHPPSNVVDNDLNNFATGEILLGGSLTLSVTDPVNDYNAGNFVGFVISSGLLDVNVFSSITIRTYLNNVLKETHVGFDLIGLNSGLFSGPYTTGFVTTTNYDEVEITFAAGIVAGLYSVHYAVMESFCAGPPLTCNAETAMNSPTFPMTIDYANTGSIGINLGNVDTPENAISTSTTDFASLNNLANVFDSLSIAVKDQVTDYPAGTFVGFDIQNLTIAGLGLLDRIVLTSYLNGVKMQQISGTNLLLGVPLLNSTGRQTVGFVTNTAVDEVKLTLAQPVNVNLGTTLVYSAIFRKFCQGPDLACNTLTAIHSPEYPVYINTAHTGFTGAACVGCSIEDPGNVIDNNLTSYAQIDITAGAATIGSLSVRDALKVYPANSFAGFRIENIQLVNANVLADVTIATYLNGNFVEAVSGPNIILTAGTDLLVNQGEYLAGFLTTAPFDEVQINLTNVGMVNIGTTRIYEVVLATFCPATIACDTTYFLNNPGFPVYVDFQRTGLQGGVCALCEVEDPDEVITASNTDYATIMITAGVLQTGSIAVRDALYDYPAGTIAGFVIDDVNDLLQADLFGSLTISTYLNGNLQEFKSGVDLIDAELLILFINSDAGVHNVGFQTTLPFDEVRITVGDLASVLNIINVYGAFVDTRNSHGGSLNCPDPPLAVVDHVTSPEDTPVVIDVLGNDSDPDSPLGIPVVTDPPSHGMVSVNPIDSTITYTPDPNFVGIDTFVYTICDNGIPPLCDTAMVIVNVSPVNDPPHAVVDQATTPEDSPIVIDVLNNDSDPDSPLGIPVVTDPPSHGMVSVNPVDSTITYIPDPNFTGVDSFVYTICDNGMPPLCDTALVIVNVGPVNDPPVAVNDSATTPEDTPVVINVLSNDSDPDSPLGTPGVTDPPSHGMVMVNPGGSITYTPDPDFVGVDTFMYSICDNGMPPLCDTARVIITVTPRKDTIMVTIPQDHTYTVCAAELTTFTTPATSISICNSPSHGMVGVMGTCATYTPTSGYIGQDMFCLVVCDPNNPMLCDTTIVIVQVTGPILCNTITPWTQNTFSVNVQSSSNGLACWDDNLLCVIPGSHTPDNVVDNDLNNFASGNILLGGSLTLSVTDPVNDYNAGNFVGFVISSSVLDLSVFSHITLRTYKNNVLQETFNGFNLVGLNANLFSSPYTIGFVTSTSYDEVEITFAAGIAVGLYNVHYAVLESFCQGPPLACNAETAMNSPTFPMTIDYANTGSIGISLGNVDNPENAISSSTTDFASLNNLANVFDSLSIAVKDQITDYPAGTFVGFDIQNLTIADLSLLQNIVITSYLNGVKKQQISGTNLLLGVPLLNSTGRQTVGFVTNTAVDEVKLTLAQPVNVNLGTTLVYSAIFRKFCQGPDLACNTLTAIHSPEYPVYINTAHTGFTGAACVGCSIEDPGNVIDNNLTSYAQIDITAGAATIGSLSVRDALKVYPANSFAGFRIENIQLVNANVLADVTIATYLNGNFVEAVSGPNIILTAGTDLLVNQGEYLAGFLTTAPFDEVQINLTNVGMVNIGTTRIYEVVLATFCPATIACDTTYFLNNPGFPVYVDFQRTGLQGGVCALCEVEDPDEVITASNTDYATIMITAGVLQTGSIAVRDALYDYPAGTIAGFVIDDVNDLLQADLFGSLTISTYLNGNLQEFKSGVDLIDAELLILFINSDAGVHNVGFQTTLPFDEVRITVGDLASVLNIINVYGAFVDTRNSHGGSLNCPDPPLAVVDHATTPEDTPVVIDVLNNDSDPDSPLGIPVVTDPPSHGMVSVNPVDSTITYIPDPNFTGVDSFVYTICDNGMPPLCDTALVIINVSPVNDPPLAVVDHASTPEDTPVVVDVLNNDSDPDSPLGTPVVTDPPSHGMVSVNPVDSTITYTPDPGFVGVDTFIYTICDNGMPPLCDTALVIVNIGPVNDPPLAVVDHATTPEDTPVVIDVLNNDSDPDSPLGVPVVTDPPSHGMVSVNPVDSTITYIPDPNFTGADSFVYTICDNGMPPLCDTALVIVNVSPVNDPPLAVVDHATTPEDTPVVIDVLNNDSDPDSPLGTPVVTDPPSHGMVSVNPIDSTITYTPDPGFTGVDTFIYTICDNGMPPLCDTALVIVNIGPVNDPPLAIVDHATTPEDTPVVIDVLNNDSDPDSPLGIPDVTDPPSHGMVSVNPVDSTITYIPDPNFTGIDSFVYTICDNGMPALCDTALVIINVSPVNDPPIAVVDHATTPEDTPVVIDVLNNDSDPDSPLGTPVVTDPPSHGMVSVNPVDSTITYIPDPNFTGIDSFVYTICDNGMPALCDTALVIVNVSPVNDPPLAVVDHATTPEDTPVVIDVLNNDSDPDSPLGTPVVTDPPSHGMVSVNPIDSTITYTPDPGFTGVDTFIYTICDNGIPPLCDTALVIVNIGPVNDPPLAVVDHATTPEDTPVVIDVLNNDSDPDSPLGVPVVTDPPSHGMVSVNPIDSTITYIPDPNFTGIDSFVYTICDNGIPPLCDTALVIVNVTPVNDPPLAVVDHATTPEDTPVVIDVLNNDSDPDSPLGVPVVTDPPSHGMVSVNPIDSTITYIPDPNFTGIDSFVYTICDNGIPPLCDTALVIVTVTGVNQPPVAVDDVTTTTEDTPVDIDVLNNDSDPDSPIGIPVVTDPPDHGMVSVDPVDSMITYTPDPDFVGVDTFIYSICDNGTPSLCDTALVVITVVPVIDTIYVTIPQDSSFTTCADTLTQFTEPASSMSTCENPSSGIVSFMGTCALYEPDPGYDGQDTFCLVVCDPNHPLLCDTTIVVITILPAPCVKVKTFVYLEGSAVIPNGNASYSIPMRNTLNQVRVLPGQCFMDPFLGLRYTPPGQPYHIAPWNYLGHEGDSFDSQGNPAAGAAGYPSTVVDWVLVSLRNNAEGTGGPVCEAAALLYQDGTIQFTEPFDCCDLSRLIPYYVVIEHRNHLIVMSDSPVLITNDTIKYDFRNHQSYINDPMHIGLFAGQKEILPNVFAMYAANGNQTASGQADTDINFDDRSFWEMNAGITGSYNNADYNLNTDTNFNDRVVWERNNGKFTSVPRN